MASALKNLSQYDESSIPSAESLSFGIILAEWNSNITHALYEACYETLIKHQAKAEQIQTIQVPGSFELPTGARLCIAKHKLDAVICIGCVIKGETDHNDYINRAVASGLTSLSISSGIPCIFGVLTPNNEEQALDRAGGKYGNKGIEAAITAIRMAHLKQSLETTGKKIGF
jgi:6,7-dimethyl-8-ribityllumazine synthase